MSLLCNRIRRVARMHMLKCGAALARRFRTMQLLFARPDEIRSTPFAIFSTPPIKSLRFVSRALPRGEDNVALLIANTKEGRFLSRFFWFPPLFTGIGRPIHLLNLTACRRLRYGDFFPTWCGEYCL